MFRPLHKMTTTTQASGRRFGILALEILVLGIVPVLLAMTVMHLWKWDLSVPLSYSGTDDVWQLFLTKMLKDTGWILETPFLGAPDIAHWQYHSAAQTSSLHSVLMRLLSFFIGDAVRIQQVYYLLNFSLISLTSYAACRMLGLARFAAAPVAFLFAFTSYRMAWLFYAFLANYAAVPLAFVPVFWIMTGQYAQYFVSGQPLATGLRQLLRARKFWLGLAFMLLVAISDGYYAFFTVLITGFAMLVRASLGDLRHPARFAAPLLFVVTILGVVTAVSIPLKAYQKAHVSEFFPDGKEDPSLVKHPFEAEVYSSSLKLMVAPLVTHRVPAMATLGKTMVDSNDAARKFPVTRPAVSLGVIVSCLLFAMLASLPLLLLRRGAPGATAPRAPTPVEAILWTALALSFFIFLCSISGGLGTLIALVYPTIRAYDRFPLFMTFALLVAAGAAATSRLRGARRGAIVAASVGALLLTVAGLYDQIPGDTGVHNEATTARFLAERSFVHGIERELPRGAMIYQYPHSQYLSDNKYYGWGSFAHMRLYLHSTSLHWSNGASKNSPVENWHDSVAALPLAQLITEIEAVGFSGIVLDRTVLPAPDYAAMKAALEAHGLAVREDAASALSFARLKNPGFRVQYDRDFTNLDRIVVSDRAAMRASTPPRMVNAAVLNRFLDQAGASPITVERARNPALFVSAQQAARGMGERPILPLTDMAGELHCEMAPGGGTVTLTLTNRSTFDWRMGAGRLPLKIGVHLRGANDAMLRWDDGYRVPTDAYIASNTSAQIQLPVNAISRAGLPAGAAGAALEFGVLQDGHAWFNNLTCRVPLPG
jgi:hypothetical protein